MSLLGDYVSAELTAVIALFNREKEKSMPSGYASPPTYSQPYYPQGSAIATQGSATTSPVPNESESKIRNIICFTEELLGQLHGGLDAMEKRLDTILTPLPPASDKAGVGPAGPPQSYLSNRVNDINGSIMFAISRIAMLRDRVEV